MEVDTQSDSDMEVDTPSSSLCRDPWCGHCYQTDDNEEMVEDNTTYEHDESESESDSENESESEYESESEANDNDDDEDMNDDDDGDTDEE